MKKSKTPKSKAQETASENGRGKKRNQKKSLIVCIGASAGGIQALKVFFENVPADSGLAYVVILHLSPDHDSQLAEVLQTVARIPVTQVTEKVRVAPNHVYVVPPNQSLSMSGDHIVVSLIQTIEERRAPVDIFFRTLAESHRERAVAVILSGTGADGSMGLKRVKEHGGAAYVQNPREAEFSEMPRNSIATDLVDWILNAAEIPARIIAYKDSLGTIEIPVEHESQPEHRQEESLLEILSQLQVRTGHNFSNYKRATVLRRIERRINVHSLPDLPSYAAFMRENPDETQSLLKDLLISVTNFFRDKETFGYFESDILPQILKGKTSEHQVRVWVAGCATGEEAYSLAMLLAERTFAVPNAPKIQIFATDIDETALSTAREGFYTLNDAADVSAERLQRFFTKETGGYRIRRELRETVLFASHNIIKDPPFSRLDLATCRNLLIYLNHTAQKRVMEIFHFALNPGSYLFLGNSETVDGSSDLYAPVSKEHHIFRSREAKLRHGYPAPDTLSSPLVPAFRFTEAMKTEQPVSAEEPQEKRVFERISFGELHQQLLEQYTPSVLINEEYNIVHLSDSAVRFMQMKGGELTQNLLKLIQSDLRLELRTALYQAVERRTNVEVTNVKFRAGDDRDETINIYVRPVLQPTDTARGFILVLFEQSREAGGNSTSETVYQSDEPVTRQLEEEIVRLKAQLGNLTEQYEIQAEEFKASSEEQQAMNEELRASSEELETSKEELQSVNEELSTVNQELKVKIEEISQTSNDLNNLINSTEIGTVFLDRNFRVQLFTPAAREIFNLIPADIGRPLTDIASRIENADLLADVKTVLRKLQTIEREIRIDGGRVFMMRALPYRTKDDRINGVILTFYDITERKRAEEAKFFLASIVESSQDSMLTINFDGIITSWNRAAESLYGYSANEAIGKLLTMLTLPEDLKQVLGNIQKIKHGEVIEIFDTFRLNKDGREIHLEIVLSPVRDDAGRIIGVSTIARDITERRRAEEELRESEERLQKAINIETVGVLFFNNDIEIIDCNDAFVRMSGYQREELLAGRFSWEALTPNGFVEVSNRAIEELNTTGISTPYEKEYIRKDGSRFWGLFAAKRIGENEIVEFVTDITEQKRAEEAVRRSEARQTYLLKLGDALRPISDPLEIQRTAMRVLGEHLQADRVLYSEIEADDRHYVTADNYVRGNVPKMTGRFPLSNWDNAQKSQRRGETFVLSDIRSAGEPEEHAAFLAVGVEALIGVPLHKDGRWVASLSVHQGSPRQWSPEDAALVVETAERTWAAIERARAEAALAASEEKYRTLFDLIDEGFSLFELLYDERGRVADYRFLEVNPAFERQTGLGGAAGRLGSETAPHTERYWLEIYDAVARTGESQRSENYNEATGGWFEAYASRVGGAGSRQVCTVFNDITTRKRTEENLAFLAEVSKDLVQLTNIDETMSSLCAKIGEHFKVARVVFAEIGEDETTSVVRHEWRQDGLPTLKEAAELKNLLTSKLESAQRDGDIAYIKDVAAELRDAALTLTRLGIASLLGAPLVRHENLHLYLSIIDSAPREWRADEIELMRELTARIRTRLERARAEEALAASEEKYRALFASMDEAYSVVEVLADESGAWNDFLFLEVNPAFQKQTGMENPVGRRATEILGTPNPRWAQVYGQVVTTGEPLRLEEREETLGRIFDLYVFRLGGAGSRRVAVLFTDITERKQGEEALRDSEERFRAMFEQANVGIVQVDLKGHLIMPNPGFCEIIGYTAEECRSLTVRDITHPDDYEREEKLTEKLIKGKIPGFSIEKRYVCKDGGIVWGQMTTTVVRHQSNDPLYALAIVEDITGRKRIEEELRESEERLRLLIESASDYAIFTLTPDNLIDSWNTGAERIFGWTEKEVLGKSGAIIFTPEDREKGAHEKEIKTALRMGRTPDERFHIRKDGSRFYASGVMTILKNEGDVDVQGFTKIARDMTDQIEAQKAVRDKELLQKLVGAQEDERKRIARDLHDELGQQLTALRLKLDAAKKLCEGYDELCGKIDEIELIAKSIDHGVDFLAWELRPAALDDLGLVAALGNYVKQWSHHSGVSSELLASNLKRARFAPEVETNLYRIVQEALNNTHKHARAKSVEVSLEKRDGLIALLVEDTGVGFNPKDKKNHLKGIGLTGMRERAALVGGTLEIESSPGKGTTVFVRIPAAAAKRKKSDGK